MGTNYEKGMYKQLQETMARLEAIEEKTKKMEVEHKQEIWALKEAHRIEVAALKEEIRQKDAIIAKLTAENKELKEEIARLKSIINNDSNNSSNPPSGDQKPQKANEYNQREKSEKKQGGQIGHKGATLTKKKVEEILKKTKCRHIIHEMGDKKCPYISRYVLNIEITPVVEEYRIHADKNGKYRIPSEYRSEVSYGNRIKAMAVALYGIGVVSLNRIAEFLREITEQNIPITTGTVYRFCRDFSEKAKTEIEKIKTGLTNSEVLYTDATVMSNNGKQVYIRNISCDRYVLYRTMAQKSIDELKKVPVLKEYIGIMVHDHETALYRFGTTHAECNAHILRYLTKNSQDTGNSWSDEMKELLSELNRQKKEAVSIGQTQFDSEKLKQIDSKYDDILNKGFNTNRTTSPKWAKKEELSLLNRLKKYKTNHLLFLYDFAVNFDNNLSERDLRKCKNRQKMSGGFRTYDGMDIFCIILSVIETAKRANVSPYSQISAIFSNETRGVSKQ